MATGSLYAPVVRDGQGEVEVVLGSDHPGFRDPDYRRRRNDLAALSLDWQPGDRVPRADYTAAEHEVWRIIARELEPLHHGHACRAYLEAKEELGLPADHVPQLTEVSRLLEPVTGFRYHPVAGLAPLRDFYGSFAGSVFYSTQYLRHPSQPLYTPEPDIVHEVVGHANQLAVPELAAVYRLVGEAVARTESDEGLRLLSRVFWFSMEFGLVDEDGQPKAYGAGILSSCGETATFRSADIRPLDVAEMARVPYDITRFQPVLFAARSMSHLVDTLSAFFSAFDDDTRHLLIRQREARMTLTDTSAAATTVAPRALLLGWDAIELWVGNARAVAGFLSSAFGFRVTAYAGPETGWPDKASYVLEQGRIRFVVTAALTPDSPIAAHVREHGDGVHNLALAVDDIDVAYRSAVDRGARGLEEPHTDADSHGHGLLRSGSIAIYGETRHTFVDRSSYRGPYLPGYSTERLPPEPAGLAVGLGHVDHVVGNVELGSLERWVGFYQSVLGFERLRHFDDSQISTEYSALMSTVVWDGSKVVLPLNEPAKGRRKSQIQEYLETYRGPGVQHIALHTDDIVGAVAALRSRGVRFLEAPATYYDDLRVRLGHLDLPWDDLQRLGILVDEEPDGWLLQIFTETITDRPTVFLEIIQRGGAKGFGAGNFKALFEAIEREQARRGHL